MDHNCGANPNPNPVEEQQWLHNAEQLSKLNWILLDVTAFTSVYEASVQINHSITGFADF